MTIEKVIQLNNYIEKQLESRYNDYGLTINQVELLIYFYSFGTSSINATDALKDLKIDKRLMSLGLKSLEAKNYINRFPNSEDKRQKDIELSLSALDICEDLIAIKGEVNDIIEAQLTTEQVDEINKIKLEE